MLAVKLSGRDLVMRELIPQDLKFDLDRLTEEQAVGAARYLGRGGGKSTGQADGRKSKVILAGEIEETAFEEPRCSELALVECGRSHRGS
jgi:hypothetical protein